MKRPVIIQQDFEQIGTVQNLAGIFEAIASLHIAQIRDKVLASTAYFNELWEIYSQLRLDKKEKIERLDIQRNGRDVMVAITSESGLIGDIDERIITTVGEAYQVAMEGKRERGLDLVVVGGHGAALLSQHNLVPTQVFPLPNVERGQSIRPLAQLLAPYEHATVYYQTYISLMRQDVAHIDLFSAVQTLSETGQPNPQLITSESYVLEPSATEIIHFMESVMVGIALGQVILESKLAQYASRFNAMYAAKTKAREIRDDLSLELHRSKRAISDERIKEIMGAHRIRGQGGAS